MTIETERAQAAARMRAKRAAETPEQREARLADLRRRAKERWRVLRETRSERMREKSAAALAREEAERLGLQKYHGKPCNKCGGTLRYTSWNDCVHASDHWRKGLYNKRVAAP